MFTEREMRRLEARRKDRFSVDVLGGERKDRRRWPDVVLEVPGGRRAIEIEFAVKDHGDSPPVISESPQARRGR